MVPEARRQLANFFAVAGIILAIASSTIGGILALHAISAVEHDRVVACLQTNQRHTNTITALSALRAQNEQGVSPAAKKKIETGTQEFTLILNAMVPFTKDCSKG